MPGGREQKENLPEELRFPEERRAVEEIQAAHHFAGTEGVEWAMSKDLLAPGDMVVAEFSPTLRCPEACPGCPDSSLLLQNRIAAGLVPAQEPRASQEEMEEKISYLGTLGVQHLTFVGGSIDHIQELPALVGAAQNQGMNVSWFTDGIPQIDQATSWLNGSLQRNLEQGWIRQVATHVSIDYVFDGDLFRETVSLPLKRGRVGIYLDDPEYSRRFKSQYGAITLRRLIEVGVKRVVGNTTISPQNVDQVEAVYRQMVMLVEYVQAVESPTEVLWTFSPWVWRPHQARGDGIDQSPASSGLQYEDLSELNGGLQKVLADTYSRLAQGKPRILANSSGFTWLHAASCPETQQIVVEQDLAYPGGRPEMLNVTPSGDVWLDPMFPGPELAVVKSIFGYRDREPRLSRNPFTQFSDPNHPLFPNIIAL